MFSEKLKKAREQRGWSRVYVARECGVDPSTIRNWEQGVSNPLRVETRKRLLALFGMSATELGLPEIENEYLIVRKEE